MRLDPLVSRIVLLSVGLAGALACSAPTESPVGASDDEVIGGVEATSEKLDAVGALLLDANGAKAPFCTGTLISPTVVLTAKHCAMELASESPGGVARLFTELGTVTFAIGSSAAAPRREVKATSVVTADLDGLGAVGFGADVAAYVLAEPIDGVAPLPVASVSLAASDVGKTFVAIGFGVRDRANATGLRTLGNITLSNLQGNAYELAWGSYEAYRDAIVQKQGITGPLTPEEDAMLRGYYGTPLIDGYEAFFGFKDGDVQVCSGDSGGPLLRKVDGKLTVFGVASWVPSKTERSPCSRGAVYALFGPTVRAMLDDALSTACGDVTPAGRCEGAVAVRCISAAEGTPRVTRIDCGDVDLTCKLVDGKAACAP